MKFTLLIILCISTQLGSSQVFKVSTAHKMLTTAMTISDAKKILNSSYDFIEEGELSDAGNIAYTFETRGEKHYRFVFLYSTAFDRIGYIQFYDDIKQTMNYRNQILKLGFKYMDTKFSKNGSTKAFGYEKGNLLYVVELGIEKGKCKVHLTNKDF